MGPVPFNPTLQAAWTLSSVFISLVPWMMYSRMQLWVLGASPFFK
jgi:hypothetical protein